METLRLHQRPPRSWKILSQGVAVFAVGGAGFLIDGCSPRAESAAPPQPAIIASNATLTADQRQNIHLAAVEASEFHKTIDTTGTVDFDNDQATIVLAPMSGPVTKLMVSVGDKVTNNQPLAEVDSPDFAAAISAYRKALSTAKITRQLADQDAQLFDHHGVSLRESEQAKIDAANAQADSDAALQQLVSLKVPSDALAAIKEGKTIPSVQGVIRSPIAGTVVDRDATPGELLQAGATQVFTIADLSRVWVMAHLFNSELGAVSVGDPAEVLTGADSRSFTGTVQNISAIVDPDTRAVAVRVVAENPGGALKQQQYVRVLIHSAAGTPGLMAPVSAVLRDDENLPFVYVAQKDESFARQRVTLGYREKDRYDITSGLKAGDNIVVDGGLFVQFMQNQ